MLEKANGQEGWEFLRRELANISSECVHIQYRGRKIAEEMWLHNMLRESLEILMSIYRKLERGTEHEERGTE